MTEKEGKKIIWKGLRISFWAMNILFVISFAYSILPDWAMYVINIGWIASVLFTFVVSIIHLTKYKKKVFAIVALVISSVYILLTLLTVLAVIMIALSGSGLA